MAKPRKQTYTLDMYLAKINEKDIRSDQDVQRLSGQWDKSMVNEIISTVLTGGYIPPVILGEENNSHEQHASQRQGNLHTDFHQILCIFQRQGAEDTFCHDGGRQCIKDKHNRAHNHDCPYIPPVIFIDELCQVLKPAQWIH